MKGTPSAQLTAAQYNARASYINTNYGGISITQAPITGDASHTTITYTIPAYTSALDTRF